jgi:hypothetical protein
MQQEQSGETDKHDEEEDNPLIPKKHTDHTIKLEWTETR